MAKKYLDNDGLLYLWQKITGAFVKKDGNKVLSTNDYTTDEKTKLAGIAAGATKVTVDSTLSSTSTNAIQNKAVNTALGNKVDKVSGKGLSTNDYTSDEKNKLAGIEAGATNTTVVDSLLSNSTTSALSANQGKILDEKIKAINTSMEDLGAGDMLKSVYDTDGSGVVDDAEKLGGELPEVYAKVAQLPTKVSQLTNDKNYITGITKANVTTALGYTPYDAANPNEYQTKDEVDALIQGIIGSAPDALNTLDELAAALNDDENFAATVTEELSKKQNAADLVAITNGEIDTIVAN
jgi:hypothetical protein